MRTAGLPYVQEKAALPLSAGCLDILTLIIPELRGLTATLQRRN